MPRIRTIKPQFWIDEDLGVVSRDARLLYIGLWNIADDQGVFEYRPQRIKVMLFPYDSITIDILIEWLNELENKGKFSQFSVNGNDFGYLCNFQRHQDIKNPSKWQYAEIPDDIKGNTNLALPQSSPSDGVALPLGNRKRVIGKELEYIYNIAIPKWIDKELWVDFLEMRKKKRATPTERAVELLIKELEKLKNLGNDPNEVLKQSIMSNWTGVFPLKEQNGKRGGHSQTGRAQESPTHTERLKRSIQRD